MNTSKDSGGPLLNYLSLFTSVGTLLCCALPSLLVLVGLGATVASFLSIAPWLVTLSHYKNWVFLVAGVLITSNWLYVYRITPQLQNPAGACPPDAPSACASTSRASRIMLIASAAIYCSGLFSAYLLGPLLMRFGK